MTDSRLGGARRPWLYVGVAVIALALGVLAAWLLRDDVAGRDAGTLLAVSLPDAHGNVQSLEQWRGKLVVVNFWATWCAPCREEMPMFVQAQAMHGAKGLQFVGIAVDDAAKARKFAEEIGVNYPTLVGGYGAMELSKTFGNTIMALPFTVIIGREGTILQTQLGPLKQSQLDSLVRNEL